MKTAAHTMALVTSADASGAWIHLLPAGTFQGRDGRGPYKLASPAAVVAASRESAGKRLMPIDYDHAIDLAAPHGHAAPAAGWIKGLQSRTDGIWGLVDWTPRAAGQIEQREYRYISPVFHHDANGTIRALLRAALTNTPNLDQLTALAAMETTMDLLAELRKALGLPDDADAAACIAKVRELTTARQAQAPDPTKYVPIGDFERAVSEVNRLGQGITAQAAAEHVAAQIATGRLAPFLKDWAVSLCTINKSEFDKFLERTKGFFKGVTSPTIASAMPPGPRNAHGLNDDEMVIAANVGVSAESYAKTKAAREAKES